MPPGDVGFLNPRGYWVRVRWWVWFVRLRGRLGLPYA